MTLKEYLEKHGIKQKDFAKQIGATYMSVNNWVNGRFMPRPKQLQAIKTATKGKVTPNDFL